MLELCGIELCGIDMTSITWDTFSARIIVYPDKATLSVRIGRKGGHGKRRVLE